MSSMKIEVACACGEFFIVAKSKDWSSEVAELMVNHTTEKHNSAHGAQFEVEMWVPEP